MSSLRSLSASFRHIIGFHKSVLSILLLLGIATTCLAGTFVAFGPKNYTRPSGSPVTVTDTFSVLNPATQYTLKAFNGGMQNDQTELVAQTVVTMNGVQIINSTNFNSSVAELDIPVTLQATNTLTVELRGKPGGVLTIEVTGVDNDPPTIKATPSPLPNAAGWNNSTVTVTFTCNDATSGVASCPAPQTVTTEGSKVISGTATDNAGNTASASITVNIDETSPTITASAFPAANSNGWNNSNVTVTFSCADSLSGVATCPSPVTTSTEAANQVIPGTATDVAGNTASASATIDLDKTPPTISITSPTSGATLTASSVSVTGNVSDSLSGVSSVTCNGTAATIQSGTFTCSVNLAFGSNTITAQASDLAGNPASASVNVFRNNPPSIASLSPTSGPVGTSVTLAGSYFGSTQGTSTITFNGVSANPASWTDSQIIVPAPSGASTGNVIVTVAGLTSNAQLFTVITAPVVNSLSPTSGPAGTSVTISGVNFGAPQGTSTVTFNGTLANATSWSDTQIIVPVPSGASTGPVVVTVAGQASNSPTFGVGTPPTIAASASPAPNASGWNNTNVTVTFTCTAGSSPVASCPGPQIITSEGANQPVSGTATDTDGTSTTKTVFLNIDKTRPALVVTSPADGSTVSSSTQTVVGSATDSLSGMSSMTCNGTSVPLSSGTFSCNISLNVGVNLIVVRATDLAGNVAGSNFHVSLPGTLPVPVSLQITPGSVTLLAGQTQQFTAVDELGRPRPDATWTISDPTLATISADSSPIVTEVAPGQFTLTARVQGVSAQIQVNASSSTSLPPGTVLWSVPTTPGFGVTQIIQAVPVANGPDLFSVEMNQGTGDTSVRALTGNGQQMWSRILPGSRANAMADGNGGILLSYRSPQGNSPIVDLDAQTGATLWENDSIFLFDQPSTFPASEAIAPDGTILVAGAGNFALDPKTGAATKQVQPANAPQGSLTWWDFCGGPVHTVPYPFTTQQTGPYNAEFLGPSVAADGTMFQVVSTLNLDFTGGPCSAFPSSVKMTLYLSQTAPDGSATFTPFHTETSLIPDSYPFTRSVTVPQCYPRCTEVGEIPPNEQLPTDITFRVIPDGQGGALVPWWKDLGYYTTFEAHVTHVSSSGISDAVLPLTYQNTAIQSSGVCPFNPGQLPCIADFRLVLGENGVAFATDLKSVVAFNIASMTPLWSYSSASSMDLVVATADGGVTINDAQRGLVLLDVNGTPGTPSSSTFSAVTPWALGNWMGSLNGAFAEFAGPSTAVSNSPWPDPDGDRQSQHSSPKLAIATFMPIAPAAGTDNARFKSAAAAKADLETTIPRKIAADRIYTDSAKVSDLASIPKFDAESANPLDVLAFIGHGVYAVSDPTNFAIGMQFTDNQLSRTPGAQGFNYQVDPGTITRDILRTSAKIIFVSACDTGVVFTTWWDMTSNAPPGGRVLIVPDLTAMAQLPINNGISLNHSQDVDLVQGTVAWEKLINSLHSGKTAQQAVNDANAAVAQVYPLLIYPAGSTLPQVIFRAIGNVNLCLQNCLKTTN